MAAGANGTAERRFDLSLTITDNVLTNSHVNVYIRIIFLSLLTQLKSSILHFWFHRQLVKYHTSFCT